MPCRWIQTVFSALRRRRPGPRGPATDLPAPQRSDAERRSEFLENVIASMHDAVILTDTNGRIMQVNDAAATLMECPPGELTGRYMESLLAESSRAGFNLAPRDHPREAMFTTCGGREVPVSLSCASIGATRQPQGYVITARNISDRKIAEQRIRYLARIDALTKVPNRMQFQHLLQRAIARARRSHDRLALLYVDLDRFKEINDSHGHTAGDLCLETFTERLSATLPESAIIGRLAGDEFGVILDNLPPEADPREMVETRVAEAREAMERPVIFQGHQISMSFSVGVAFYPVDATNVIDLIRNADAALYYAKRDGGAKVAFYDPDMNAAAIDRLMLKSRLRQAFEKDELLVHYQPKVDLSDGALAGAEALVRWSLADRGMVFPNEFIPLAEESNMILEIGEWVLERVCTDLHDWAASGADAGRVSVNLSLRQLNQTDFLKRIAAIIQRTGTKPSLLELELTESTMMENPQRTIGILNGLHEMGLQLAIDDFGTGYSSLSALQQFPIRTLKIDQSFVSNATSSHDQATIVSMIIEMGHSLGMDVVAEGVESLEQLRFLRALNCDYAQGTLFGHPMSAADFRRLIEPGTDRRSPYREFFRHSADTGIPRRA